MAKFICLQPESAVAGSGILYVHRTDVDAYPYMHIYLYAVHICMYQQCKYMNGGWGILAAQHIYPEHLQLQGLRFPQCCSVSSSGCLPCTAFLCGGLLVYLLATGTTISGYGFGLGLVKDSVLALSAKVQGTADRSTFYPCHVFPSSSFYFCSPSTVAQCFLA